MNTSSVKYLNAISIPAAELNQSALLFDPRLNGSGGIDTKDLKRGYPDDCRKEMKAWLAEFDQKHRHAGATVVQTFRNLIQNPRCIAYSRNLGLCQTAQEQAELSQRPYYGISFLAGGKLRADAVLPVAGFPSDVEQFGGGVPVLWNGHVLTIEEMVTEVADFSHIWQLRASSSGSAEKDVNRFMRLQAVFHSFRHAKAADASAALIEEARGSCSDDYPLVREHGYLHNLLGVRADGGPVIIVANGSLEELGELGREAGAVSAIVIDNGGSCSVALRRSPVAELRALFESHYHRPPAVAVAVYAVAADNAHRWRLQGTPLPWSDRSGAVSVTTLRNPLRQVAVRFDTDVGVVIREVQIMRMDSAGADAVALTIGNFAVLHGAVSAAVVAPPDFVLQVQSKFRERYRVAPRSEDPDGMQGLWLEDYLKGVNGAPFRIDGEIATEPTRASRSVRLRPTGNAPAQWALGIDIGATTIKCGILHNGEDIRGESNAATRGVGDGSDYQSRVLFGQLKQAVEDATRAAGIVIADLHAIGVSWPGAVRDEKVAPSKTLLDMSDVWSGSLNVELFRDIRNLGRYMRSAFLLPDHIPIRIFNDGEVEVLREACTSERRAVLLCKLGGTVAGGFIDTAGNSGYLTELGRAVIRTDSEAPRHPWSRIQGIASRLIGSIALARICQECGLTAIDGTPISNNDAGRELSEIISAGGSQEQIARSIVEQMGSSLTQLILECIYHLGSVEHILLRGGLMGRHAVGAILRESVRSGLPSTIAEKIATEEPKQHSGAIAAAWLVARHGRAAND